jgi:hypothetical protein
MRSKYLPLFLVGLTVGCAANRTGQPLAPELARNDADSQVEFWHELPERKAVSNDEAFHAVLLFADGGDPTGDYSGRASVLKQRGMLPGGFAAPATEPVRRGTLAVALAKVLQIKGGVTMQVFGPSPRYAVRELQYAGLFPPSSPQQTFSGAEFLGIIGRAEDYQRMQAEGAATPELGGAAPADGGG